MPARRASVLDTRVRALRDARRVRSPWCGRPRAPRCLGAALAALAALAVACAGSDAPGGETPGAFAREPAAPSAAWIADRAGPPADPSAPWLQVVAPSEGELLRSTLPLIELRGRVGRGPRGGHDVVIALDQSQSSLLPTGLDLDRDGAIGTLARGQTRKKTRGPFMWWTTDRDDVVIHGEVCAARRLLASLDPLRARVAVVSFSGEARVRSPLGSVADAHRALDVLRIKEDYTGSNMADALRESGRLLESAPAPPDDPAASRAGEGATERRRAVFLVVSDGVANVPMNERAARARARAQAEVLREMGIAVFAFEIKNEEDDDPGLLGELAELSDGRHVYVDDPAALQFELPELGFARVDRIDIRNRTARQAARAVRVFPNGAFDAFVPLVPGENHIEVEATLPDATRLTATRIVYFIAPGKVYPSDLERMEALRDALRRRTLATTVPQPELRTPAERSVEIEVERGASAPPAQTPEATPVP
jgi:hypothetical protein